LNRQDRQVRQEKKLGGLGALGGKFQIDRIATLRVK
jgi:hypothetical protein